jgi:hypothetical protein
MPRVKNIGQLEISKIHDESFRDLYRVSLWLRPDDIERWDPEVFAEPIEGMGIFYEEGTITVWLPRSIPDIDPPVSGVPTKHPERVKIERLMRCFSPALNRSLSMLARSLDCYVTVELATRPVDPNNPKGKQEFWLNVVWFSRKMIKYHIAYVTANANKMGRWAKNVDIEVRRTWC